ncbi:hypothetical protein [Sphingobacterium corticibacterium]|uniref:Outer membrane protein beta-barrel domain-containing protein n=1 Tax=Sphingobacterium corticibacterium TaxID=2484746 RepID=A0A4Q6XJW2_9SPHI|nr:hypothetical protein [Sphingobacterium corticibacterium]RZF59655.1 hypothetical protein EWE74_10870 [Sphingobacterium corticibacterium]
MAKFLTFLLFIQLASLPMHSYGEEYRVSRRWQDCEQVTKVALDKLVDILRKNDFEQLETVLNTIQSVCGENEFTQRLRILRALVEKKTTGDIIADYLAKNYQEILVMRWDYSVEEKYVEIYQNNKADFDFVPLRHPIDPLIKKKALALLNSPSYNLTEQEEKIALLFADDIDAFYELHGGISPSVVPSEDKPIAGSPDKYRHGVSIYAGAEIPLTGSNPVFKTSPTLGVLFSSRLSNPFLFEAGLKVRINTSHDREVEYRLYDDVEIIRSTASLGIGGTVGYKIFDNDKFIIAPKAGLFWELATTGLSEVNESYYDDGYDYYETQNVRYFYINTMRSTLALSVMRHLSGKTYVGLEAAYHHVPYNWDSNLLTSVQPNYGSLQLFFRF